MGLFDIFKSKNKPVETMEKEQSARAECDISKTQIMSNLFSVPSENRDENWKHTFFENVMNASFSSTNPQVSIGPDGLPYFTLNLPEAGKPFESFCIKNMMEDFLLEKGLGVTINSESNSLEWVFSYGDIVNLQLNNEFYSKTDDVEIQNEEKIEQEEEILIAQPSQSYLPLQTRNVIKTYLQEVGIKEPKMMMICRTIDGQVIRELAFNIFRDDFQSLDQLNNLLRQLSWYLPRHYIIVCVPKSSDLVEHFDFL